MATNLTVGPPTRSIVLFTIPLLIGNLFQQLYAFTDAAVVGRLIDVRALAAVGAAGGLQFLLIGFTFGAAGGLAIPVARAFGAGDFSLMRRFVAAGAVIAAAIAAVITAIGTFGAHTLLTLLNTPPDLIANSEKFLAIAFAGTVVTMAYNYLASVIRALGDSRTPLIFLIIACVLNAGLVALFIGVFHLGVAGASAATVLAQFVSVALCLILIAKKIPQLRLRREDWHFQRKELGESARLGLTMGFQMSVIAVGSLILQYAINGLGSDAVAAFTAAIRVDQTATAPLASFGLGMATFVAQNRGARHWKRIRIGVFRICLVVMAVSIILGAIIVFFGTPIAHMFVGDNEPEITAMAHEYLIINGALYILLAILFLLRNSIQGLGRTAVPTAAGVMELIFRALAGLILVVHFGFLGACLAAPLAWIGALIPLGIAWIVERKTLIKTEAKDLALKEDIARETGSHRFDPAAFESD
ncbi:MAG: MATE family efflux transporter [Propionibacteriaceae bacterium]|jgi:putative MATE family efflux protein|nr:MATE family efflux transporter [Propionibacteriaceae bacterium]